MPDLSTLTGSDLVTHLLQSGGMLGGLQDYQGNDVTDLIVDEGSNSNGYWFRLVGGWLINFMSVETQSNSVTNTGLALPQPYGYGSMSSGMRRVSVQLTGGVLVESSGSGSIVNVRDIEGFAGYYHANDEEARLNWRLGGPGTLTGDRVVVLTVVTIGIED